METKAQLGRRIKDLRKKRGLTQEGLAEAANVDVKYLGNIERGRENPSISTLEKVANTLNVKLHELLAFEHEAAGKQVLKKGITQILNQCDEKELRIILRLVRSIRD